MAEEKTDINMHRRAVPLMGMVPAPKERSNPPRPVKYPVPEVGKKKCQELKGARQKLAEANGIPYESSECRSVSDCEGTCPACDKELDYLNKELARIPEEERIYPEMMKKQKGQPE